MVVATAASSRRGEKMQPNQCNHRRDASHAQWDARAERDHGVLSAGRWEMLTRDWLTDHVESSHGI